jgi:hypothetical protein
VSYEYGAYINLERDLSSFCIGRYNFVEDHLPALAAKKPIILGGVIHVDHEDRNASCLTQGFQ